MPIDIEQANQTAVERMMAARPRLTGLARAGDVIPALNDNLLLHAGPPIEWARASGPLRGAVIGALLFEGRARGEAEAVALVERGEVRLEPCHHHGAVGPMAGVISSSMQVYVIEDAVHGHRTFSNLNEGYGKVLRYGAFSEDVLDRLRWINKTFAAVLGKALALSDGIDLRALVAEALHMGDEGHNRNKAGSLLYLKLLAPWIAEVSPASAIQAEVLKFLGDNPLSVLNPVMAACKAMADAAHGIEGSTIVSTMARNGTDFGIRVSGLGDRWFTAPAQVPDGLYFPGFSSEDANPDIGDSTITETAGHRRLRHGRGAGDRNLYRRLTAGRAERDAGDVRDHRGRAHAISPSRRSASAARPWESTCARWWSSASRRASTPASPTGKPASDRWGPGWSARPWESSRRRSWPSRRNTTFERRRRMYVPYDLSKVKVLDLSQNFSVDSPPFAFYEGPTIKWVKKHRLRGGERPAHLEHQPHRHPPRLALPLLRSRPGHRGHPASIPCSARPASWTSRSSASATIEIYGSEHFEAVGEEDRHHDRARRHPGDPHRLPPLLQRGLVQGPQPGEARPAALLPASTPARSREFCDWVLDRGIRWMAIDAISTDHPFNTKVRMARPDLIPEVEAKRSA